MPLSDYQRLLCMKALDHLKEFSIHKIFAAPVDPVKDECPDYLEKIKNPMDLGTIRKKLIENRYETVQEFKTDVNLIWENTATYHTKKSIIYSIALQLDGVFQKDMRSVTGNDIESWLAKNEEIKIEMGDPKLILEACESIKLRKQHPENEEDAEAVTNDVKDEVEAAQ